MHQYGHASHRKSKRFVVDNPRRSALGLDILHTRAASPLLVELLELLSPFVTL